MSITTASCVRFTRNGEPVTDSMNRLSAIAYHHTAGIVPSRRRLSVAEFRALLAGLGVTEPESTEWSVTLPNGLVIGAVREEAASSEEDELLDLLSERLPDVDRATIAAVLRAYAWHRIGQALDLASPDRP